MLFNQKELSITVIIFSIITLCLAVLSIFQYVNIDIMMLFLGFTQIASGLSQINLAQQVNEEGEHKGNRAVGIISIILGVAIVTIDGIKFLI